MAVARGYLLVRQSTISMTEAVTPWAPKLAALTLALNIYLQP